MDRGKPGHDGLLVIARSQRLAMTVNTTPRSRGAISPELCKFVCASEQRAQGMPGARCTRGLVCQKLHIWRTRAYRAAETLRHPLRNGFTAYFVLSPVSGLFCHRHLRIA